MNVYDVIKSRRTVRRFKQEPIDRESIIEMIDAARVSPSAGNIQSLKYAIILSKILLSKYSMAFTLFSISCL